MVDVGRHALEQDLLDCALDRAQREALLEQGIGLVLVEGGERRGQAGARRGSLAALTGQDDRARDVVGLGQRRAQRLDLAQRVLPVPARRAAGAGEAVTALRAAQRVGADGEHHGRGVRADPTHDAGS